MSTRVYVGNIPYDTRERDLESFFKSYGRIRDISLKNGYAFVDFDDHRDAEDAVYEMDGKKLLGRRVSVEAARGKPRGRDREIYGTGYSSSSSRGRNPPVRTNYRIFVENLSSTVSWQDLKDHLSSAGEVTFADAHKKYKNEGIAEFASYDDMKRAIKKFDDTVLNGRRIKIVEDKSSKRSYSKSRSRSRSRRSRSKSPHSRNGDDNKSRSRSKSVRKSQDRKSRSRSHKSEERNSRSKSKSADGGEKRSRSRSRSESPVKKARRSNSPNNSDRSRSRSHSN